MIAVLIKSAISIHLLLVIASLQCVSCSFVQNNLPQLYIQGFSTDMMSLK